jgi:hypothetical protein
MLQFDKLYEQLRVKIFDYDSLLHAMTDMTTFFHDGHTNIEIPYTPQDYCLNLACEWCDDERLILQESYENIEVGAEIIAIENVNISDILQWSSKIIPHENKYLVKSRMLEYPYLNYHVFSSMNLSHLFGDKKSYEITFVSDGNKMKKQCELKKYNGFLDFKLENSSIYYAIQGDTAVLHLNACICNELYRNTLQSLAIVCKKNKVKILEIDLSKNMGGSSAIIDEFIKYVNKNSFRRYEMIDYSSGIPLVVTSRKDIIYNPKMDVLFPETIVCRVSNTTFSSAKTFAVTLKDNEMATIVGKPTGGKPSSYGMPRRDQTPIYNISFRVSRALFLRPDDRADDELTLYPQNWK